MFHHAGSGRCIARSIHSIDGKLGTTLGTMRKFAWDSRLTLFGSQAYESKEIASILGFLGIVK